MGREGGEETLVENPHSRSLYSQQGIPDFFSHDTAIRKAGLHSPRCRRLNAEHNKWFHTHKKKVLILHFSEYLYRCKYVGKIYL